MSSPWTLQGSSCHRAFALAVNDLELFSPDTHMSWSLVLFISLLRCHFLCMKSWSFYFREYPYPCILALFSSVTRTPLYITFYYFIYCFSFPLPKLQCLESLAHSRYLENICGTKEGTRILFLFQIFWDESFCHSWKHLEWWISLWPVPSVVNQCWNAQSVLLKQSVSHPKAINPCCGVEGQE